jgi:hypothetical protein
MTSKLPRANWENEDNDKVHSPNGVLELRKSIKAGLTQKYVGIIESMFQYEGFDNPKFELMQEMSRDTVPEKFNYMNGKCCWFLDEPSDSIQVLPFNTKGGINIYGNFESWRPIPVGYEADKRIGKKEEVDRIYNLDLNTKNSVIMKNDIMGSPDNYYVNAMINELVDNQLTLNQLQLLAKCPFIFKTTEDNVLSANNFFLALSSDKPVIFTNKLGEDILAITEQTKSAIDPQLFNLMDRFDSNILEYVGIPCVPITKSAQQTDNEINSGGEKIVLKRLEKYNQRTKALERVNKLWGTNVKCISIIDAMLGVGDENDNEQNLQFDEENNADNEVVE